MYNTLDCPTEQFRRRAAAVSSLVPLTVSTDPRAKYPYMKAEKKEKKKITSIPTGFDNSKICKTI